MSPLPLHPPPPTGPKRATGSQYHNPYVDGRSEPLKPLYLPFKVQHLFHSTVQKLLEQACFYFATRHCPEVLRARGWDIPEAGEFNNWWAAIRFSKITAEFMKVSPGLSLRSLFQRLNTGESVHIYFVWRFSAVHFPQKRSLGCRDTDLALHCTVTRVANPL
jgi:hypothetical protein